MQRFLVNLTARQMEAVRRKADKLGIAKTELIRRLLDNSPELWEETSNDTGNGQNNAQSATVTVLRDHRDGGPIA